VTRGTDGGPSICRSLRPPKLTRQIAPTTVAPGRRASSPSECPVWAFITDSDNPRQVAEVEDRRVAINRDDHWTLHGSCSPMASERFARGRTLVYRNSDRHRDRPASAPRRAVQRTVIPTAQGADSWRLSGPHAETIIARSPISSPSGMSARIPERVAAGRHTLVLPPCAGPEGVGGFGAAHE
jgi:hypothetical protein